jgi:hypothetical protein
MGEIFNIILGHTMVVAACIYEVIVGVESGGGCAGK